MRFRTKSKLLFYGGWWFILASILGSTKELQIEECLPNETGFLFRADISLFRESFTGQRILLEIDEKEKKNPHSFVNNYLGMKFSELQQLWVIIFSQDCGITVLKGDFKPRKTKETFFKNPNTKEMQRSGWIFFASWLDKNDDTQKLGGLLDEKTFIFGEEKSLRAYLIPLQNKTARLSNRHPILQKVIQNIDPLVGTIIQLEFSPFNQNPLFSSIQELWFTGNLDHNTGYFYLTFMFRSEEKAKQLTGLLQGIRFIANNPQLTQNNDQLKQLELNPISRLLLKGEMSSEETNIFFRTEMNADDLIRFLNMPSSPTSKRKAP